MANKEDSHFGIKLFYVATRRSVCTHVFLTVLDRGRLEGTLGFYIKNEKEHRDR